MKQPVPSHQRVHRAVVLFGMVLLLVPLSIVLGAKIDRNWTLSPAIAQSDTNEDIYVVGDVHGDYKRLVRVLEAARVIGGKPSDPTHPKWIANRATVVFMGDLIDKGDHALDVINFVQALGKTAKKEGGQLFTLMGNHEAEFLADPTEKKVKDFASELTMSGLAPSDVAACRGEIGAFLCAEPFAVRIRSWFFSHAGNTHGRSMNKLISDLQAGVGTDGFGTNELIGDDSILEARLGEKDGGPWFESGPKHDAKFVLSNYTAALGVKHIVLGHQPEKVAFADGVLRKKGQMFQRYGLVFLVDTGMSKGVDDSQGAVLHIKPEPNEDAIVICPDGTETTIWDAKHTPAMGVAKACTK